MICLKCGRSFDSGLPTTITPALKDKVMDGSLFLLKCPQCGAPCLAEGPLVYHDPEAKILVVFSETTLNASQTPEGYTCRRVEDVGSLIEKVKIFDAGLDDVAIEICKFVTRKELGKEVELKFLKMDGSDGELTLAYPGGGQMEMVCVGANVYSDALAIISRNPSLEAIGLEKVDATYISSRLE